MSTKNSDHYFLKGGGQMGELIRAKDWSKTSLGDPAEWPQSLRTMVAVMLDNPFGMYIAWGNDYTQLYNDGYRPILGNNKHPQALGISTRETFEEIWHIIESMFDGVMQGKAVGFPDLMLPLNRNGFVEECFFDFAYSPIRKDNGEVGGVLVTVIETTNKKKTEEALKESEARFRAIADDAPVFIFLAGENAEVEYLNKTWRDYTGLSSDYTGRAWAEITHIEDIDPATKIYMEGFNNRQSCSFENRQKGMDGIYRTILWKATPRFSLEGQFIGMMGVGLDIHERKESEVKLRESEMRFRRTVTQAPVAMCIFRGSNYIVEVANDQMLALWGKQGVEVLNKPIFEGLPEAKNQGLEALLESVYTTGEKFVANERPVKLPRNGKLETTYINFVYDALKETDGTISGIVATAVEVTQQVIARSKVEESEQKVRALVENAPFPIAVYVGKEMIVELANQSIIDIWGKGNDVIGKSFKEVLPELDNQLVFEQIQKVLATGQSYHTKNTPLDIVIDGKIKTFYFNYSFTALYDVNGNIYGVMNTGVDLTELSIAKKRIEESDERFRSTMHQAPVGIAILRGPEYIVEMANDAYLQLVARKEEEFVGRQLFDVLPEVQDTVHSLLDSVLNTGVPFHGNEVAIPVNRYGKQEVFYFDFLYHPLKEDDGKISGVIVSVTEVSEKVAARKRIEESEERFRLLAEALPQLTWVTDEKGNREFVSFKWKEYSGIEPSGEDEWKAIVHPDDYEGINATWAHSLNTGAFYQYDVRLLSRSGEYRWHKVNGEPVLDKESKIVKWVGAFTDIHVEKTFSKELEEKVITRTAELKSSEEKFYSLFNLSPICKTLSDAESGKIIMINDAFTTIFGYSREEALHKTSGDLGILDPNRRQAIVSELKASGKVQNIEVEFSKKTGEKLITLMSVQIIRLDDKQYILSAFNDISGIKKAEQNIKQKNIELEKMNKELQSFAYISSHDLQEPLRKIQTFVSRILEKEEQNLSDNGKDMFNRMQNAANRMQILIKDLLAYSRTAPEERQFENTDLNIIVEEVKDDFKEELNHKHATIESAALHRVNIIPFQFKQLLHNLIGNALKFADTNRVPVIQIKSEVADGKTLNNPSLLPQKLYCHIRVTDNGIGFEQQHSEKIFELFQRLHVKSEYTGTGMGLSIVKKIVENHHGIITASGKLNEGAIFDIYIPA